MASKVEGQISVSEAAELLGLSPQAVRDRVKNGGLGGEKKGRYWYVNHADVLSAPRPKRRSVSLHTIQEEIAELRERETERDQGFRQILDVVERERDRYRAEAATAKEAALRVNAAASELRDAVFSLLQNTEQQSAALTQLLAPLTPEEASKLGSGNEPR